MDLSLSEEQQMLQDSVDRFVREQYPFDARQQLVESEAGFSQENWAEFARLGWLSLPLSSDSGGLGGGAVGLMILMECFGKGLVIEPYLSSIVLTAGCLTKAGSGKHESVLAELMAGSRKGALAFVEADARYDLSRVATRADLDGGGFLIHGTKNVVLGGPAADYLVVPTRTSGEINDSNGITLFLVPADADGISRQNYATVDGHRASEIRFDGVRVEASDIVGKPESGHDLLQAVIRDGSFAVSAEAVGAMEVLVQSTVEYCKTREQFGQPIGKFQVLQHRMADMFMAHEQTKSLLYLAAIKLDSDDAAEAQRAVYALKVQVGRAGRFVGQNAIQLHGGMGMTEELAVGHYFKRLTVIETLFGNADYHLKMYANSGGREDV